MSDNEDPEASYTEKEDEISKDGEVPEDARSEEAIIDIPASPDHKKLWLRRGFLIGVAALVILAVILVLTLNSKGDTEEVDNTIVRYDCHPDQGTHANKLEENCKRRGCIWIPAATPRCSYPPDYANYNVETVSKQSDTYYIILLNHTGKSSGFDSDIRRISVHVLGHGDSMLRVKIFDADAQRWEVPLPTLNLDTIAASKAPRFTITAIGSLLRINRTNTGTVLFETDLTKLIFADQFIQLTVNVSSTSLYGFGERQAAHEKSVAGLEANEMKVFTFMNRDGVEGTSSYGSHPFYMMYEKNDTDQAHGVLLLNSNPMDITFRTAPSLTYRTIGGVLDFLIFMGPTAKQILRQKARVIGQSAMPPYWALGFHLCRWGYHNDSQVREAFTNNTKLGVPIDTQWADIDYMDRFNDFTYDPQNFSQLPDFVKFLHANGRRFILSIDPSLGYGETPAFDTGRDANIFVRDACGDILNTTVWNPVSVIPDFTNPNASSWWTSNLAKFHQEVPFDGLWLDMNEPTATSHSGSLSGCTNSSLDNPQYNPRYPNDLENGTICMSAQHSIGRHYNVHSLFSLFEGKVTFEALTEKVLPAKRPFILSRATTTGQGMYTSHWLGDVSSSWKHLRSSIPSILDFNLFGIPLVGSDICGFNLNTTDELCSRWTSLGSFYTFARNHNSNQSRAQDPASMGPNVLAAATKSLNIRYTFLPYLYTLFFHSSKRGDPVLRSLKMNFPEDKETNSNDKQFMWGDGLLVNPVLEKGSTSLVAYFPAAVWYHYPTGHRLTDGTAQNVTLDIPVTDINIALRGGKIFPLIPSKNHTTHDHKRLPFTILAVLNHQEKASGDLYWDDGESLDAPDDTYSHAHVHFSVNNSNFRVKVKEGFYDIENSVSEVDIWGVKDEVEQVLLDGQQLSFSYVNGRLRAWLPENMTLTEEFHIQWM